MLIKPYDRKIFTGLNVPPSPLIIVRVHRPAQNLVEAASNGAIDAIKVVSSVAANLIAILGLIAFLNEALSYLGGCVGVPQLSFKVRTHLDR